MIFMKSPISYLLLFYISHFFLNYLSSLQLQTVHSPFSVLFSYITIFLLDASCHHSFSTNKNYKAFYLRLLFLYKDFFLGYSNIYTDTLYNSFILLNESLNAINFNCPLFTFYLYSSLSPYFS